MNLFENNQMSDSAKKLHRGLLNIGNVSGTSSGTCYYEAPRELGR